MKKTSNRAVLASEASPETTPENTRVRVRAAQAFREYTGHERSEGEVFETALETAQSFGALVEILPAE
jgi:hypothetical protein